MQGNVTFDPLAFAEPVLKPEIAEILDLEDGEFLDVATFISRRRYDRLVAERVSIRENLADRPRFGCALCATPVYLVASREKRFFFRHCREDGSCPSNNQRACYPKPRVRSLEQRDSFGKAVALDPRSCQPQTT